MIVFKIEIIFAMKRLSRVSRSASEVPDERIKGFEVRRRNLMLGEVSMSARVLDIVERERFFPVKGEIP